MNDRCLHVKAGSRACEFTVLGDNGSDEHSKPSGAVMLH